MRTNPIFLRFKYVSVLKISHLQTEKLEDTIIRVHDWPNLRFIVWNHISTNSLDEVMQPKHSRMTGNAHKDS